MTKHILIVSYSQTGQLTRLAESFVSPLRTQSDIMVEHCQLQPQTAYEFPWRFLPFFNAFPESVHLQPAPIKQPELNSESQTDFKRHACDYPYRLSQYVATSPRENEKIAGGLWCELDWQRG